MAVLGGVVVGGVVGAFGGGVVVGGGGALGSGTGLVSEPLGDFCGDFFWGSLLDLSGSGEVVAELDSGPGTEEGVFVLLPAAPTFSSPPLPGEGACSEVEFCWPLAWACSRLAVKRFPKKKNSKSTKTIEVATAVPTIHNRPKSSGAFACSLGRGGGRLAAHDRLCLQPHY